MIQVGGISNGAAFTAINKKNKAIRIINHEGGIYGNTQNENTNIEWELKKTG